MRLLVVDDVDQNSELLARAVKDLCEGDEVVIAKRATEGIEAAIEKKPRLIFMDIGLPDMDGVAATKILKSNPLTSQIPVIAVSADVMSDTRKAAMDAGCIDFVTKPISIRHIRALVAQYVC